MQPHFHQLQEGRERSLTGNALDMTLGTLDQIQTLLPLSCEINSLASGSTSVKLGLSSSSSNIFDDFMTLGNLESFFTSGKDLDA